MGCKNVSQTSLFYDTWFFLVGLSNFSIDAEWKGVWIWKTTIQHPLISEHWRDVRIVIVNIVTGAGYGWRAPQSRVYSVYSFPLCANTKERSAGPAPAKLFFLPLQQYNRAHAYQRIVVLPLAIWNACFCSLYNADHCFIIFQTSTQLIAADN